METNKILSFSIAFILGLIIGWLNPIEGPLDWAYDEYASQPAHKSPSKASPPQKEIKELKEFIFEEEEDIDSIYNYNNLLIQEDKEME